MGIGRPRIRSRVALITVLAASVVSAAAAESTGETTGEAAAAAAGRAQCAAAAETRFTLRPHRKNYVLTTYSFEPNNPPELGLAEVEEHEIKFQLSLRYDLISLTCSRVTFAYTGLSFWQLYNTAESAPFRTTDHEPELFWERDISSRAQARLGVVHESNGESASLSRSWNRVVLEAVWFWPSRRVWNRPFSERQPFAGERKAWRASGRFWWNFDHDELNNPLIDEYLGAFELRGDLVRGRHQLSVILRNSLGLFGDGRVRGAYQLEYGYRVLDGLQVIAQGFNGYGESLLDYDVNMKRVGVGLQLSP